MKPTHLVIHHSAGPRSQATGAIRASHMAPRPKGNGWADIGYHKIIEEDGSVHQGRPDHVPGAHAPRYNTRSLGICVVGDFTKYPLLTYHAQYRTLVQTCAILCGRYGISVEHIIGHRDAKATACPGDYLYALLQILRWDVEPYIRSA